MKYFILAGEASGDKQAALLCRAINNIDPDAILKGWGGEEMQAAGVSISKHYRGLAFMGFVEVIRHLPEIFRNLKKCKQEILTFAPDALILVDYPGFNLRIAGWAEKERIRVYYYISPQLWAWHTSRVHRIKRAVRRMYVILPFEKEFYAKYGVEAVYIGHPLSIAYASENGNKPRNENQIALLPGSRKHEIELLLPEMVGVAKINPTFTFVIVAVPHLPLALYENIVDEQSNVRIVTGNFQNVLQESKAAIVTSGTATLETALAGTPQVVVYKGNPFSYQIAKRLIKVPYISLVNLIAGHALVPELIQRNCNPQNISRHLSQILQPDRYAEIREGYVTISKQLAGGGGPELAANDIFSDLVTQKSN